MDNESNNPHSVADHRNNQPTRQGQGYLATLAGANVGFIIGALLAFLLMMGIFPVDMQNVLGSLLRVLLYVGMALVGGSIGGLIGAYAALSAKRYSRRTRTLLFMIALYPLTLIFLGADFLISALFVPLIARWLALKF